MVTRRVAQRQFLLVPCDWLEQLFLFCLAVAANRTGIVVHSLVVMSNHYHLIASDPEGRLPEAIAWLNEFVARAVNARLGRWESLWSSEPPSYVRLLTPADIIAKIVYAMANPVAAGLVSHGSMWPGIRIFKPTVRRIRRPDWFFRDGGPLPDVAELRIVAPSLGMPEHQAIKQLKEAIAVEEANLREKLSAEGKTFQGPHKVRAQRRDAASTSWEPRRELSPRIASQDKWRRIEALQRSKQFLVEYREALTRWRLGAHDVVFPHGTYQLARRFSVRVAKN